MLNTLREVTQTTVQPSYIRTDLMVTSRIGLSDSNQCGSPTFLSWILCETPEQILVHYRILSPGFTDKAKVWNRDVFGNLFHRKKRTLARLRGAQIALSNNPNNFLS